MLVYHSVVVDPQGRTQDFSKKKRFPLRCEDISVHFKEPEMALIIVK